MRKYSAADWNGHVLYQCALCPYAVLDDQKMIEKHILDKHSKKPKQNRKRKKYGTNEFD